MSRAAPVPLPRHEKVLTPDRSTQLADVWRKGLGVCIGGLVTGPLVREWAAMSPPPEKD